MLLPGSCSRSFAVCIERTKLRETGTAREVKVDRSATALSIYKANLSPNIVEGQPLGVRVRMQVGGGRKSLMPVGY